MEEKIIKYVSSNNKDNIVAFKYIPNIQENNIKGIIQIVHGMSEHMGRYKDFIKYMVEKGYVVCGNDHIGHGLSASNSDYGNMGNFEIYNTMVLDVNKLTSIMKDKFPNSKYIILGHSMGSFLTRYYIEKFKNNNINGIILSGTMGKLKLNNFSIFLSNVFLKMKKENSKGKFFEKISSKVYNSSFIPLSTNFDWLTRDKNRLNDYIQDEKCGFTFTYEGYRDLFKLIKIVSSKKWYKSVPKTLPIFIFSGEKDPVGNYGKGVKEVYNKLLKNGCINVKLKLYKNGRHEMLNEINKEEVFYDIYNWVKIFNN